MNFRTEFFIPTSKHQMQLSSKVVTLGSCFSDVVGNSLKNNKLEVYVNQMGTLFNPLSIFKVLSLALQNHEPDERLYLQQDELWFHYDFHSSMVGNSKEELQNKLVEALITLKKSIENTDFLAITFGTAFVHQLQNTPVFVANCHKQPKYLFEKDLLSVKDICKAYGALQKIFTQHNLKPRIILTVSPVRHTREGIPQNQVSKSILRAACHYLSTDYEDIAYFPSYEIMLDDLRDYRFYKPDLIHPSEMAEAYIFEKFGATYFSSDLKQFVEEWQSTKKALAHRPFNEKTEAHQKFLQKLRAELLRFSEKIDVSDELALLEERIVE